MKKIILIFLLSVLYINVKAQVNLVPNPSFELSDNCPTRAGGTPFCLALDTTVLDTTLNPPHPCLDYLLLSDYFDSTMIGWSSYRETPDYYNSCANSNHPDYGVPNNRFGTQAAHNGNAYVGIVTYNVPRPEFKYVYDSLGSAVWDTTINHYIYNPVWDTAFNRYAFTLTDTLLNREIIGTKLDSNLTIGIKYFVTFWVCRVKNNNNSSIYKGANNHLGMKFSTVPYSYWNPVPINNFAQIYINTIVSDSVEWTRVSGSFIADSSYGYISIGNFFDGNNTYAIDTGSMLNTYKPYYYIDDVCVSSDSLTCYTLPNGINYPEKQYLIDIYPNPFSNQLMIENKNKEILQITIYDMSMRKVYSEKISDSKSINTEQFESGVYFYEFVDKNNYIQFGKLIKN